MPICNQASNKSKKSTESYFDMPGWIFHLHTLRYVSWSLQEICHDKYDYGLRITISNYQYFIQVANLAVFTYFIASLFSRQFLIPDRDNKYSPNHWGNETFPDSNIPYSSKTPFNEHTPDFVFPFFTLVEFICYIGWIKVAESLLNPFGGF